MTERDAIERRLSAVERAVSGGEDDLSGIRTAGERDQRLTEVEAQLDALDERVTELEAATQALRGYVGNVRSVNRDVERRAEAALAAVDRLEGKADPGGDGQPVESADSTGARTGGTPTESSDAGTPDGRNRHASVPEDGPDSAASPSGSARPSASTVDDLDTGPAMQVPGAENDARPGGESRDPVGSDLSNGDHSNGDERSNGDGVFDRVRDAL